MTQLASMGGDTAADMTRDEALDADDIALFFAHWESGC